MKAAETVAEAAAVVMAVAVAVMAETAVAVMVAVTVAGMAETAVAVTVAATEVATVEGSGAAAKGVMVDRKRRVAEVRVAVVSAAAGMAVVVTGEEKGGARVEAAEGEMGVATEVPRVVVMEEVAEVATA